MSRYRYNTDPLERERLRRGLSYAELGRRSHLSRVRVHQILHEPFSRSVLTVRIARALRIDPQSLLVSVDQLPAQAVSQAAEGGAQ